MEPRIYRARGTLRIVFDDPQGNRETFYPGLNVDIPVDRLRAEQIRAEIELAILEHRYTPGLLGELKSPKARGNRVRPNSTAKILKAFIEGQAPRLKPKSLQYKLELAELMERVSPSTKPHAMADALLADGRTTGMTLRILRLLSAAYDWAVLRDMLSENPYKKQVLIFQENLPKKKTPVAQPFTREEQSRIEKWFKLNCDDAIYRFICVFFREGFRPGEIAALNYEDLKDGIVVIDKNVSHVDDQPRLVEGTKTGRKRRVKLFDETLEFIPSKKTRLCFEQNLSYINQKNISKREWPKCLKQLGIPHRKLYSIRSTVINRLIDEGMPIAEIARRLDNSPSQIESAYFHRG